MKFFILLALIACSTPEKKVEAEKPASPYTVKPCYCMKIFRPVCAGGQNYGNSCEAECHGHKTWTEGSCANKKK
jgi:hypothetical protein